MYAIDLTPDFNELLKKFGGGPTAKVAWGSAKIDGFLKEAYRINGHIAALAQQLRDVRQAYLSTALPRRSASQRRHKHGINTIGLHRGGGGGDMSALTDAQREEIDGNAKRLLRDLNASIRALADAESLHHETQQALVRKKFAGGMAMGGFGGLGRLARLPVLAVGSDGESHGSSSTELAVAEEELRQAAAHRESVLWYLQQRLQACGRNQQTMMEARVARMVELTTRPGLDEVQGAMGGVYELASKKVAGAAGVASSVIPEEQQYQEEGAESGLTQEQLQMFERGNQDMIKYYETTLDKVRAAEKSLIEISELQTMLVGNLEMQSAHVDQMVADSFNTATNVERGNQELKKALDRPSTARYTFYAASGLCAFVVVWDFFV